MPHFLRPLLILFVSAGSCYSLTASAALRPARIFQDHMILQREKSVPVWGWADPGAGVKIAFAGQEKQGRADTEGYWRVALDPLTASASGSPLTITSGTETHTLVDVLVGEVWLCAGQSNMARPLQNDAFDYPRFKEYQKDADYPLIRFFACPTYASTTPQTDLDPAVQAGAKWQILSPSNSAQVMSIPFFFAKDLTNKLKIPIGLIQVAVSGTPLTSWMAKETFDDMAAKLPGLPDYQQSFAESEVKLDKSKQAFKNWAQFQAAESAWKANPTGQWPGSNPSIPDFPSVLYNGLVHPLAPFALEGVLWHQGESGPGPKHSELLMAMVQQWRKLFGQDFYFIWGTLTRSTATPPALEPSLNPHRGTINEEFLLASQTFGPGGRAVLVNFYDLGNASTHWAEKMEAGHRMAGAALSQVYGRKDIVFTGPELVSATIEGPVVRAKFRHIGGGLVYEPSVNGISGFVIAGGGAELRWANVAIEGDTVVFSHPDVPKPTNVYYGWDSNPHETLFNREGYPAMGFRAVSRTAFTKGNPGEPFVELVTPVPRMNLNISHVRRNGFLITVGQPKTSGSTPVRVRVPAEWEGATVTIGGQPVAVRPIAGGRVLEFDVEINGPDVLVANTRNAPDFSGIERF